MIARFATKGKPLPPIQPEQSANVMPSAQHWRRFRRLITFMMTIAVLAVGTALWILHRDGVVLHPHFVIAVGLGITMSLLLAGVLMGLVFLSANSGHDDAVIDPADRGSQHDPD
jgi:hypothetical protein